MTAFNFNKHFQRLGYRSPHWQRAKLLAKMPLMHMRRIKEKFSDKFSRVYYRRPKK